MADTDKEDDGLSAEARAKKEEEELREYERKIEEHELIFRKLKDATGVRLVFVLICLLLCFLFPFDFLVEFFSFVCLFGKLAM